MPTRPSRRRTPPPLSLLRAQAAAIPVPLEPALSAAGFPGNYGHLARMLAPPPPGHTRVGDERRPGRLYDRLRNAGYVVDLYVRPGTRLASARISAFDERFGAVYRITGSIGSSPRYPHVLQAKSLVELEFLESIVPAVLDGMRSAAPEHVLGALLATYDAISAS